MTKHNQKPLSADEVSALSEQVYDGLAQLIATLTVFKPLQKAALHDEDFEHLESLELLHRDLLQQCEVLDEQAATLRKSVDPKVGMPARFDLSKIETILQDFHERLCGVTIECKSYDEFIAIYDRPDTLFYLDPPYWGSEKDYGKDCFNREDFTKLREILRDLKGTFILSLNDLPEVRAHFTEFNQKAVETTYSVCVADNNQTVSELIISNTNLDFTPAQSALF